MRIKDFEVKYNVSFDGCFAYDALLKASKEFRKLPMKFDEDGNKNSGLTRVEFVTDFMNLEA